MLRTLLRLERTFYITRQEKAPLLREREAFLEHLLQQGTSVACGTRCVMAIAERHQVAETDSFARCVDRRNRRGRQEVGHGNSARIRTFDLTSTREVTSRYVAKKWLRFAGVLKRSATSAHAVRR